MREVGVESSKFSNLFQSLAALVKEGWPDSVNTGLMEDSGTATGSRPRDVFSQAVLVVLKKWNALQIAVDNQFGGQFTREKAEWLRQVTADYFWENGTYEAWSKKCL